MFNISIFDDYPASKADFGTMFSLTMIQVQEKLESVSLRFNQLDDDAVMLAVQHRQHEALEEIIQRYQTTVLSYATRFLGDASVAGDVAQDVFLALWRESSRYVAQGSLRNFLITMTINRCRYLIRQQGVHNKKMSQVEAEQKIQQLQAEAPIQTILNAEKIAHVCAKLKLLPEKVRESIILRFTQDMPLEEIAHVTGQPLGTVKSHLSRGLKRLYILCEKDAQ